MILTNTGPLVALINRNDPNHGLCVAAANSLPSEPLVTTWACFTETMYLVHRAGGYSAQEALWALRHAGRLLLLELSPSAIDRAAFLMGKYQDLPMDLADATLVAAADELGEKRVFTLDSDFRVYRLADGSAFQLVP